jgi:hypothetical protein
MKVDVPMFCIRFKGKLIHAEARESSDFVEFDLPKDKCGTLRSPEDEEFYFCGNAERFVGTFGDLVITLETHILEIPDCL